MKSADIARIVQRVNRMNEGRRLCATFQIPQQPHKWVQYGDSRINAAYPSSMHPAKVLDGLGGRLEAWEAQRYVTVWLCLGDDLAIAEWIEQYFDQMLSGHNHELDFKLAGFRHCAGA
jgi:hypothetical protein